MLHFLKSLLRNIAIAVVIMAILSLWAGSVLYLFMTGHLWLAAALVVVGVGALMTFDEMAEDDEAA